MSRRSALPDPESSWQAPRRGVYRSGDAGRSWGTANLGIRDVSVRSLAIDPTDPAVLFAASPRGIYQSRDRGGETWIEPLPRVPTPRSSRSTHRIVRHCMQPGQDGVHKSTDGGRTWQDRLIVDQIADLVIDPNNPRRLLAAYKSVYQSLDGAERWEH